ncbi:hypothetical protein DSO57_1018452 [Entomophthora muscae]|uniref:Uncharacterized protein n=1 Tax=Entomophthora muscae TaxID=34485 RepID=A0ACC2RIY5_9FUNG|nr:hypothetical protein DSO57_1018452 [Entomophthora muscae]
MAQHINKKVIYKKIPIGLPTEKETFNIVQADIDIDNTKLAPDTVLVRNLYVSLDPYMRGRMRDPRVRSYVPAFKLDTVLETLAVAEVVKTASDRLKVGDIVSVMSKCENYSVVKAKGCTLIDNKYGIPLTYYLSVLGLPGLTAFIGLFKIGCPKAGETMFVSGASGAVGQIVGQLAKLRGLRVVGSAGTDEKVNYLTKELNFDAAFNYKKTKNLISTLKELCPSGIDIYFDNVGGETLEAALSLCNDFARVPLCGMISQYNSGPKDMHPIKNLILAVPRRIRLEGFIATDDHGELQAQFIKEVTQLVVEKKIKISETIDDGVENIPSSLISMFSGRNNGKQLVKLTSKL